jgi:DNA-directed RNA polymerase specialized sigma24 family protein
MNEQEFDQLVGRMHSQMIRFAYWLDSDADAVADAIERLVISGAYLKHEPHEGRRLPPWLAQAVKHSAMALGTRLNRQERIRQFRLKEQRATGELIVAKVGDDGEDGFKADGDGALELSVPAPDFLERLVQCEDQARLIAALGDVLAELETAVATALRLVYAEERPWKDAAEATGVGVDALKKRVARALPGLRRRILSRSKKSRALLLGGRR